MFHVWNTVQDTSKHIAMNESFSKSVFCGNYLAPVKRKENLEKGGWGLQVRMQPAKRTATY